jgi:hypothetical protein
MKKVFCLYSRKKQNNQRDNGMATAQTNEYVTTYIVQTLSCSNDDIIVILHPMMRVKYKFKIAQMYIAHDSYFNPCNLV